MLSHRFVDRTVLGVSMTALASVIAVIALLVAFDGPVRHHRYGSTLPTGTAGLGTPDACPGGSVSVTPSSVPSFAANTNYCFASGTYANFSHTIATGDGFYGQGNAVLDGGNTQLEAFSGGTTSNVTIDGFTIKDYTLNCTSATSNCGGGYSVTVNTGNDITITDNTFGPDYQGGYNGTGGVGLGAGDAVCQYPANITTLALGSTCYNAITNSFINHNVFTGLGWGGPSIGDGYNNQVDYNVVENTDEMNQNTEGDISAIGKFALDSDTTVDDNYLTDNPENGIWFDVFDVDSTVENNTFAGTATQQSAQTGVFVEISCNTLIQGNTFDNIGYSDAGTGNWGAAVRISSSGSSQTSSGSPYYSTCGGLNSAGAMPGPYGITVTGNAIANDLDGVALFDGHAVDPGVNNSPIPDTNITDTGNSFTATTTAAYTQSGRSYSGPTESDALVDEASSPEYNISFSGNTYALQSSHLSAFGNGTGGADTFSQWQTGLGFDTSGSSCTASSGSC